MQITLPLILIALGSLGIVAVREARLVIAALLVQWGGIVLMLLDSLGWARVVWFEGAVALVSVLLLAWTILNLRAAGREEMAGIGEGQGQERHNTNGRQSGLVDQALLWVTALAGGVAGFGLARLYPLGGSDDEMLAFFWLLLSASLSLVVHGARDMLKLGTGLLVLLNAVAFIIETLALDTLDDMTLGLLGVCRVALVALFCYLLVALKVTFLDADLDDIFDARLGIDANETALVLVGADGGGYSYVGDDEQAGIEGDEVGVSEEDNVEAEADIEETPEGKEADSEAPGGG